MRLTPAGGIPIECTVCLHPRHRSHPASPQPRTSSEWPYEVKLDGFRGMLCIEDGKAFFRSKTKSVMRRFQDLADALVKVLDVESAVFEGVVAKQVAAPMPQARRG